MEKIGKYSVPTIGDEIVVRPTLWERIMRTIYPDPWAAEEREALLQHARRIKLKTDLQEARIKQMQERKKQREEYAMVFKTVAVCQIQSLTLSDKAIGVNLTLSENKTTKKVEIASVFFKEGGAKLEEHRLANIFKYVQDTSWYLTNIRPWLEGAITTEKLKELSEKQDKKEYVWRWVQ